MERLKQKKFSSKMRASRTRSKIYGTADRPRLSVNISNTHVSAQLIDDTSSKTLAYATTVGTKATGTMTEKAAKVGVDIAKLAQKAKIKQVIFDRGSKLYHGRIKALADSAREGGLEF